MAIAAVILCGGSANRLGHMKVPKPLTKFFGIPFIKILCKHLSWITDDIIVIVKEGNEKFYITLPVKYLKIASNSISQSIHSLKDYEEYDRFVVCYGDTLADVNMGGLLSRHMATKASITVTTHEFTSPFGIIECFGEEGLAKSFEEKPKYKERINIGYIVIDRWALDFFNVDTLAEAFDKAINAGELYTFNNDGEHYTFNTKNDIDNLEIDDKFKKQVGVIMNEG